MSEARGKKVRVVCRCGVVFYPRAADVARGWGKFHSKSCKAKEQEGRTGQHAAHIHRQASSVDHPFAHHRGNFADPHFDKYGNDRDIEFDLDNEPFSNEDSFQDSD